MDNLSHSIVGLAIGELIHRSLPPDSEQQSPLAQHDSRYTPSSLRRGLLLLACCLASNFPDLDLFFSHLLPAPLGYMLHHRGHTHTLLYAFPQAILLTAAICLCWPAARKLLKESRSARIGMTLAVGLGFVSHIAMDYLNSYGVHPFHPFDSRWFYGDLVFIVEPFFWILFGVPMAMTIQRSKLRWLSFAVLLGIPLFFTFKHFLLWQSYGALALSAGLMALLQRRAGATGRRALIIAPCLMMVFIAVQGWASQQTRGKVVENLRTYDAASVMLDASMSAFPANPLCWSFVSIESNEQTGLYRLRRGVLSLAPSKLPVTACPTAFVELDAAQNPLSGVVLLTEEYGRLDVLRKLQSKNCYVDAWLRFARMPLISQTQATDMRFKLDTGKNFTTMNLADIRQSQNQHACSRFIPGWDIPRMDLLSPNKLSIKLLQNN